MDLRKMKYKYNIQYKLNNKRAKMNFNSKKSMIRYLDKHNSKVNELVQPVINFGVISLPLKSSVWNNS